MTVRSRSRAGVARRRGARFRMATFPDRRRGKRPLLHVRLLAGVLAVCVLLLGLDGWRTWQGRQEAVARDIAETDNLARALAQQAHDVVQTVDAAVSEVRERVEHEGGASADRTGLTGFIERRAQDLPLLGGLSVLDAEGLRVSASAGAGPNATMFEDRGYFRFHAGNADRGLHVGPPIRRKADGVWVLTVSRRVDAADGSFAGVVVAAIAVGHEQRLYESFSVGRRGVIALLSSDGTSVLRVSAGSATIGTPIAASPVLQAFRSGPGAGNLRYVSEVDGVERLSSFRRVDGTPLFVVVSHAMDEVLAQWRADGWLHFLVTLGAASALAVLGAVAARQIRSGERTEHRYRMLADNTSDAIICLSADGRLTYASPAFHRLTGRTGEEVDSLPWGSLVHPEDRDATIAIGPRLLAGEEVVTSICRYIRKDGSTLWVESCMALVRDGDEFGTRFVGSLRDITKRKAVEDQLAVLNREVAAQAVTDPLTGLANRRRFDASIETEWRRAMREGTQISLLMIDVDRFKLFNDRYGHQAGDRCLQVVSAAVADLARRPADLSARYGGEELAVLLPVTEAEGAAELAERVRAAIAACAVPHEASPPAGVVTASIGYATLAPQFDDETMRPTNLVAAADAALYEAKRRGRNRAVSWSDVPSSPTPPAVRDEEQRLAAVALAEGSHEGPSLDRLAGLTAALFDVPACMVSLVGQERQCFIGRTGLDISGTGRDVSFCAHTIAGQGVFTISDATRDARFSANALVIGEPGIRFYAGAPLSGAGGHSVGALCLIDFRPREPLDPVQKALLTALAAVASGYLDQAETIDGSVLMPA